MGLANATADTFAPYVDQTFGVAAGGEALALTLASVRRGDVPAWPGARIPFSLAFHGPPAPLLSQAIYIFNHAELGELSIFIVPVGRHDNGIVYEAVFN